MTLAFTVSKNGVLLTRFLI